MLGSEQLVALHFPGSDGRRHLYRLPLFSTRKAQQWSPQLDEHAGPTRRSDGLTPETVEHR